jgi:hypothetical protein
MPLSVYSSALSVPSASGWSLRMLEGCKVKRLKGNAIDAPVNPVHSSCLSCHSSVLSVRSVRAIVFLHCLRFPSALSVPSASGWY